VAGESAPRGFKELFRRFVGWAHIFRPHGAAPGGAAQIGGKEAQGELARFSYLRFKVFVHAVNSFSGGGICFCREEFLPLIRSFF
jgi:hypothetical protein